LPFKLIDYDDLYMGSSLLAICGCGYEARAFIGSSRASHGRVFVFPHRCHDCSKLVNVDLHKQPVACPECAGQNIEQYGLRTPVKPRAPKPSWYQRLFRSPEPNEYEPPEVPANLVSATYCYVLESKFALFSDGNLCPKCGQVSLQFELPDISFD